MSKAIDPAVINKKLSEAGFNPDEIGDLSRIFRSGEIQKLFAGLKGGTEHIFFDFDASVREIRRQNSGFDKDYVLAKLTSEPSPLFILHGLTYPLAVGPGKITLSARAAVRDGGTEKPAPAHPAPSPKNDAHKPGRQFLSHPDVKQSDAPRQTVDIFSAEKASGTPTSLPCASQDFRYSAQNLLAKVERAAGRDGTPDLKEIFTAEALADIQLAFDRNMVEGLADVPAIRNLMVQSPEKYIRSLEMLVSISWKNRDSKRLAL